MRIICGETGEFLMNHRFAWRSAFKPLNFDASYGWVKCSYSRRMLFFFFGKIQDEYLVCSLDESREWVNVKVKIWPKALEWKNFKINCIKTEYMNCEDIQMQIDVTHVRIEAYHKEIFFYTLTL